MLKASSPYLLLDTSSRCLHVGILLGSEWVALETTTADSLTGIFTATETALKRTGYSLPELAGFITCRGPGSLLGLRVAAMALAGWHGIDRDEGKSLHSYISLQAQAISMLAQGHEPGFHLCSDYRENQWNFLSVDREGTVNTPTLIDRPSIEALDQPLYFIPQRQREQPNPANAVVLDYDLQHLPKLLGQLPLNSIKLGEPIMLHEPAPTTFVKWSAERHRGNALTDSKA